MAQGPNPYSKVQQLKHSSETVWLKCLIPHPGEVENSISFKQSRDRASVESYRNGFNEYLQIIYLQKPRKTLMGGLKTKYLKYRLCSQGPHNLAKVLKYHN